VLQKIPRAAGSIETEPVKQQQAVQGVFHIFVCNHGVHTAPPTDRVTQRELSSNRVDRHRRECLDYMGVDELQQRGSHLAGHITFKSHYENIT